MTLIRLFIALAITILFITGCDGGGSGQIASNVFGIKVQLVSGDQQILENPGDVAQDLVVKVVGDNDKPLKNVGIEFVLTNPESGAVILGTSAKTNDDGIASTKVKGGDDYAKVANIKARVTSTNAFYEFTIKIRDKIVPHHFEFVKPADVIAGGTVPVKVKLLGKSGRQVTEPEFDTEITMSFTSLSNAANTPSFVPAPASRVVQIKNGEGSFLVSSTVAEDITIGLLDQGPLADLEQFIGATIDVSATTTVKVLPDIPTKITIENPTDGTTDAPVAVKVTLQDQYNNNATNYTGSLSIRLKVNGNAMVNTLPGGANLSFTGGQSIAQVTDTSVETVNLSLENPSLPGMDVSSTQDIVFAVGAANKIVMEDPTDGTVDNPITVSVQVQDQYGNPNTNFSGKVKLNVDSPTASVSGSGLINISSGVGNITVSNSKVEMVNLTMADTQGTGLNVSSTQDVYFAVGIPKKFVFSSGMFNGTADNPVVVTVYAQDQYGNRVYTYNDDVRVNVSGSGTGSGIVDISSGQGSINITNRTVGVVDLTLQDIGSGLTVTHTAQLTIVAGVQTQFVILNPLDGTVDNPIPVTVEAQDNWGNRVLTYNQDVTLLASGSSTGSGVVDIISGAGVRNITNLKAETVLLSLTDSQATGLTVTSTQDVVFGTGLPKKFVLLDPVDGTVDGSINVQVQVHDVGGNIVSTYNGSVSITVNLAAEMSSSPGAKMGIVVISNGLGQRSISDRVAETVTIGLSDSAMSFLDVSMTQDVVFAPGVTTQFSILEPIDGTVDQAIPVTVQAQDQYGNKTPIYQTDVSLTTSGSATSSGLVDIVNGQGIIAVSDHTAETVNLGLSDSQSTGLSVTSTKNVVFAAGAVSKYAIRNPVDGVVGTAIPVTIEALDQFGNRNPDFTADVSLSASGSATLPALGMVDINNGIGVIQVNDVVAELVNLSLIDSGSTGLNVSSTQDVIFSPGPVSKFVILDPTDGTVDYPVVVTVQAQDQYGNVNPTYQTDVTLNVSGSATVPAGGMVNITNGIGLIAVSDTMAETITLSLTDSQSTFNNVTSTQNLKFNSGSVTQFTIVDPVDGTVDTPIPVSIHAKDQYGNINTLYNTDVSVVATGSAIVASLGLVNITNGLGTINVTNTVAETVQLTLSDSQATGNDVSSTQDVIFRAGVVTQFKIIDPIDGTVDNPIGVKVEAQDQYGNRNLLYTGGVTLNSSGNSTGGGLVSVVGGQGILNISDQKAETVFLTLVDSQSTTFNVTSTQDVVFAPGAVTQYVIVDPVDGTVDNPISVTVQAKDQYGNININYFTDVSLVTSGSATGGGVVDIASGIGTLTISDQVAETVNLTLTDSSATGKNISSNQSVIFSAGSVTKFVIINPVDGTVDNPIPVSVEAQDQYGNKNLNYNTDVTLQSDGFSSGGGLVNIQNGTGALYIADTVAETVHLSLVDTFTTGKNISSTQDVIFSAGVVTKYTILNPTDGNVDLPILVTVQAQDQYGNRNFNYHLDVSLNTSGSATGSGLIDIVNGVGSLNISDSVAELVNLTLTDTQATGKNVASTQDVYFAAGAVSKFIIKNPADGTVDNPISVVIEAQDQFGNKNPTYNSDVTLNASGNAVGDGLIDIVSGVATVSLTDTIAQTVILTLSDSQSTGLNISSTQDVIFSPGVVTKFVIIDPIDGTVDNPIPVTVEARDQYGNMNPNYQQDVALAVSGSATGAGVVNIINGSGWLNVSDQKSESVTLSLVDALGLGIDVSNTQVVQFAPGVVTKFTILDPADGTVDNPISVTIQAQDQYNNLNTNYQFDVTLNLSGGATGGGLVDISNGVGIKSISSTLSQIVTLTLTDTEATGKNVSSTQTVFFGAGNVSRFVIVDPVDGTTDDPVTVTVQAQDQFGNINYGYQNDIFLNASGFATGAGLVDIINGVGSRNISDTKAETITLSLTDAFMTGFNVTSTQNLIFAPGIPRKIVILNPTDGTTDNPIQVQVEAQDNGGNRTTGWAGNVTLNVNGSATGAGTINIVNGVGSRNISDTLAETVTINLTDTFNTTLNTSSTQDVIFSAGAVSKLVIMNPADGTVDAAIPVRVQAQDSHGNKNFTYNNLVQLNADGAATGDGSVTIQNGEGVIQISNQVAETVNLSLTDLYGTGLNVVSTQNVIFAPGVVTKFTIINPSDGTVDNPIPVTIEAQDQFGNKNLSYNSTVTLATTGSATGAGVVNIVSGSGVINISDTMTETVGLSLIDSGTTGLIVTSTQNVIFSAGTVTQFVVLNPVDGTVDSPITVTVEARDQYGNRNYLYNNDVTLNASGGAAGGGLVDIVSGTGFRNISSTLSQIVNLTLSDSQGTGKAVISSQDVIFSAGTVTQFIVLNPPDGTVDAAITVNIEAQDQFGNKNATYNNDVTLNASGGATGGGLVDIVNGVGSRNIASTLAQIVNLTLTDSQSTGNAVTSTQDIIFASGSVTKFSIINPTDGTVDNSIPVTVEAQDQYGNKNLTYSNDVTLNASGGATGGGLVDIVNGTGIRNISSTLSQTVNLTLSDTQSTGKVVTSTQDVIFTPGVVTQFVIKNPTDGTVDNSIPVTVEAQDQFGNKNISYAGGVTLLTDGSATGGGLITLTLGQGTRNISDSVAQTVNLTLSDTQSTGLNISSTQDVVFSSGVVTQFVVKNPIDGTVDNPITVTVEAQDQFGNKNTAYNNDVTLIASGGATGAGLVDIVNGSGIRNISSSLSQTVNLTLVDTQSTGKSVSSSQDVVFSAGVVTQFAIINPADGTVDNSIPVTVEAQDQYGNKNLTYSNDVTLNASGGATGGGLVDIVNGAGVRNISSTLSQTVNLTLSDTQSTGKSVISTQDVIFTFGTVTKFVVLNPVDGTVDNPIPVTVQAQDQHGNLNLNYNGSVGFVLSGSAVGSGLITFASGVAIQNITDAVSETVIISLTDTLATGKNVSSTQNVVFASGTVTQFAIINPIDGTVDGPVTVTVEARDQYGNKNLTYNNDVTLSVSGGAAGGGLVDIVNGTGTRNISSTLAQTVNLTLSDTQSTGLAVSSTQDLVFASGVVTKFVIINPADGTVDSPIPVTVQAQDQFGNINTLFTQDVTLTADNGATGGGLIDIVNGVGSRSISKQILGLVNLGLVDTQGTGKTVTSVQDVYFNYGVATKFVIIDPTDGTVDAPISVTVQAQDQYGNINVAYENDVTLNVSGSATGGGLVNITGGVGTRNISDAVSETVTLSLAGGSLTTTSTQNVVFGAGVVTQFVILNPVDGTTDNPIAVTVEAIDQFGNMNLNYSTDVSLVVSGSATGAGLVNIQNGQGSLNIADLVAETVTLSLSDTQSTGKDVSSVQNVIFAVGVPNKFVIIDPADGTVDNPITVTVKAQDAGGNTITTYNNDVSLQVTGSATGFGLVDIINGTGVINISDTVAQTVTLSLQDTNSTGLNTTSTQSVLFAAGAPSKFVIVNPVDGTIDSPILVQVKATDQYGNKVLTYQNDVTLNTTGSASGGGLVFITNGEGSLNISDTVAETVNLSLSDTQSTGLNVSSTQNVIFRYGSPTKIVIVNPTDGTTDNPITVSFIVQDAGSNTVLNYNGSVRLDVSGAATGSGTVNLVNGLGSKNISDSLVETVQLSLTDSFATNLNVTSVQDVIFAVGVPAQFKILQPAPGTVDNPVAVTIQVQDAAGNLNTSYQNDVTLNTTGSATGGGQVFITNGVGIINISNTIVQTVTLSLSDTFTTGLNVSSTSSLVFSSGSATHFVIINPADGTIDDPIPVTVQARDQFSNLATTYQNDVTLTVSGSATVPSSGLVNIINGTGTIQVSDLTVETVNLGLSDSQNTTLGVSSTQNVVFSFGIPRKFVIQNPMDGTTDNPVNVTVEVFDNGNNRVTSYQNDVTLLTTGQASGGGIVNIVNGVGVLPISDTKSEIITLSLSDTFVSGLNITSTQDLYFAVGVPNKFTIIQPANGTVDGPISVRVEAQDAGGNLITNYQNNVTLNANGSATGDGLVEIMNGFGTLPISNTVVGIVALTLTDTELTGLNISSTKNVEFKHGIVAKFILMNPVDGTTDAPIPIVVKAYDQFNNLATTSQSDVTLVTTGSAAGAGVVDVVNGIGTLNISDTVAETVGLTLTNGGSGVDVTSAQDVVFGPGTPARFDIVDPTDTNVLATTIVTVKAVDNFGNTVPTFQTDVTLVASGQATGGGVVNIVNGVGTLTIANQKAETVTLSLIDHLATNLNVSGTQNVVFTAGPADKFTILTPVNGSTDTPVSVTVEVHDIYGNKVLTYSNDVTLAATGSASGEGLVSISAGTGSLTLSDNVSETVTLTLNDTQSTGLDVSSTKNVFFAWGVPVKFVILDPVDGVTTSAVPVTIQAQDSAGNMIPTYQNDVTLNAGGMAVGDGLVNITNGVGVINLNDTKAETVMLTLIDSEGTGLITTSTQDLKFSAGIAVKFVVLNPLDGSVLGPVNVTVQAQDLFGNKNTSYGSNVILSTTGNATGGGEVDIIAGEGSLAISDSTSEIVTLSLIDFFGTGLDVSSTQDVYFAPGTPVKFAFIQPPNGTTDGPVYVTVEAQDSQGDKVPTYTGKVTVNTTGSALGARVLDIVEGKGVIAIYDPVVETITLSLTDSHATGLNCAHTVTYSYAAGLVKKIIIEDPPDSVVRTDVPVVIKAVDINNVLVSSYSGVFTLNLSGSATGGGPFQLVNGIGEITITNYVADSTTLSLSDTIGTGLNVTSTQTMNWSHGPAARVHAHCDSYNIRTDQNASCYLHVYDIDWNHVSNYNGSMDALVDGSATIDTYLTGPKQKTVTITNGTAAFNVYNSKVETMVLNPVNSGGTTFALWGAGISWQAGIPLKFVIIDPVDSGVGLNVPVRVEAWNVNNVPEPTYNGIVYLNISGSATGGGYVVLNNGIGTVNVSDNVAETVNLSLTDINSTGLNVSSTQNLVFAQTAATKIVIENPTDSPYNATVPVTVKALTATNVVDPNFNGQVTLVASGSATGEGVVTLTNGIGTLNLNNTVAETVNLSLLDTHFTGLNVTSTQNVIFTVPVATKFAIINPVDGTTDSPITVYVHALDSNNNIATNYQSDVTLNVSGSATGDGLVDIVNGIGSIEISNTVAETVNLSLQDTELTSLDVTSTQNVVFGVGLPAKFLIVNPTDGERGDSITVTVEARNAANNIVTSYNGNVQLNVSGSAAVSGIVIVQNGVGTVTVTDAIAETVNLTLTDYFSTGFDVTSTQNVVFASGAATHFYVVDPTDSPWNVPVAVTVQARTKNNLVDVNYQNDVTLNASGSATGGGLVSIVNGAGSLQISDTLAETVVLSLADSESTLLNVASTQNLMFTNPVPVKMVILNPVDGTTDNPITVTIQVLDAANNLVPNYQNDVTLNASGSATGDGLIDIVNGQAIVNISDLVAETVNLTLTDSEGTTLNVSSTQNVVFAAVPPTQLLVVNPIDGTTDAAVNVTFQAKTALGNIATQYSGVFGLNITGAAPGSITAPSLISIVNGVATVSIDSKVPQTITIGLTDPNSTGLTVTSTQDLIFSLGAPSKVRISAQPVADSYVNQLFTTSAVVQLTDADDNVITSNNSSVATATVYKSSGCTTAPTGTLGGTTSKTLTSGQTTFNNLTYSSAEAISISFAVPGYTSICSQVTSVYNPLSINITSQGVNTGDEVELQVTGGIPPLSGFSFGMNGSGASLLAAGSCPGGATCIKYKAGMQGGENEDSVNFSDSKTGFVSADFVVSGALLKFMNPVADSNYGTPGLDLSRTFTIKNIGTDPSVTGALNVTLSPDNASMWSIVSVVCTGADLAYNQTCTVDVTFNGSSGSGSNGTQYFATVLVQGATSGKKSIQLRGTK